MTLKTTLFAFLTLMLMSGHAYAAGYTLDISETADDEDPKIRILKIYIGTFNEDIKFEFGRDYIAIPDLFEMHLNRSGFNPPESVDIFVDNTSYNIKLNQGDPNQIYAVLYHALGPMEETYSRGFLKGVWRHLLLNSASLKVCERDAAGALAQFLAMPIAETEISTVTSFMGFINSMNGLNQKCFKILQPND